MKVYVSYDISIEIFLRSADSESSGSNETVAVKDNFQTLDVGLGIRASYAFDIGVIAGFSYNKCVTNINEGANLANNQNNVFQVWVGYSFLYRLFILKLKVGSL